MSAFTIFIYSFAQDKDLIEATNHILGLTDQLREAESSLKQSQCRESKVLQETEEYKRRFRETRHQNAQINGINIITWCFETQMGDN